MISHKYKMIVFDGILVALVGYLLGSIPFAVIIARVCGVNILKAGSGNPGATNVSRTCGKFAGRLCFVLDASKGVAACLFPKLAYLFNMHLEGNMTYLSILAIIMAILGHSFSPFLKFRGGKGVSTAIGGLIAFMWKPVLICLILWVIVFYTTKYVSVASIAMATFLPVVVGYFFGYPSIEFYLALILGIVIIVRHKSNIIRLINGTENRFK